MGSCFYSEIPCMEWRQTQGCRADGRRETDLDQTCDTVIEDEWSGYCECGEEVKKMEKGCDEPGRYFTCNEACNVTSNGKNDIIYFIV